MSDSEENETQTHALEPPNSQALVRIAFLVEGALLLLAVVLGFAFGVRFWEGLLTDGQGVLYGVLLSLPLVAGAIAVLEIPLKATESIRRDLESVVGLLNGCRPIELLIIALLAGICEEALFRGLLQPLLTEHLGATIALSITAVVFGALHPISWSYFIIAALVSVYLGVVYIVLDSLAAPMALHATYDFAALMYASHLRPARKGKSR